MNPTYLQAAFESVEREGLAETITRLDRIHKRMSQQALESVRSGCAPSYLAHVEEELDAVAKALDYLMRLSRMRKSGEHKRVES